LPFKRKRNRLIFILAAFIDFTVNVKLLRFVIVMLLSNITYYTTTFNVKQQIKYIPKTIDDKKQRNFQEITELDK
jgi:cell division protein FtsL